MQRQEQEWVQEEGEKMQEEEKGEPAPPPPPGGGRSPRRPAAPRVPCLAAWGRLAGVKVGRCQGEQVSIAEQVGKWTAELVGR